MLNLTNDLQFTDLTCQNYNADVSKLSLKPEPGEPADDIEKIFGTSGQKKPLSTLWASCKEFLGSTMNKKVVYIILPNSTIVVCTVEKFIRCRTFFRA